MPSNWFTIQKIPLNLGAAKRSVKVYALAEFHHWEKVVSYLVVDRTRAFLFDTGMGYESIRKVVSELTALPLTVLLSHSHWDHIGSVHEFSRVGIFDHHFEKKLLQEGFASTNTPELSDPTMFDVPFSPRSYTAPGAKKFFSFGDGEVFASDNFEIQVIHTPGHTPGSVCFYMPELQLLATGDTLYPGPLYALMPESNVNDFAASLKKLTALQKETLILPGHNSISESMDLVTETNSLFETLQQLTPDSWPAEVKGEKVSVLLPGKAAIL